MGLPMFGWAFETRSGAVPLVEVFARRWARPSNVEEVAIPTSGAFLGEWTPHMCDLPPVCNRLVFLPCETTHVRFKRKTSPLAAKITNM